MADDENMLQCATHGLAYPAYVCGHLARAPQQAWFCDYPSRDTPWPDAWCAACDQAFQEYGEWNEKNDGGVDLQMMCHCCYETKKGSSVAPVMEKRQAAWQPRVTEAIAQLQTKQDQLGETFDLFEHERWEWDQGTREIVFSNAGKPAVAAKIQFVGSTSTITDTWLWAWANPHFSPPLYRELLSVRTFGEVEGFANLTIPKWPAGEVDGWEMTALAARLLGAQGAYRTPDDNGFLFMLLMDVRRVQ